ncbi:MAG: glycosyltransferase family 39 protein [Gammaproteobacteria bacterium]
MIAISSHGGAPKIDGSSAQGLAWHQLAFIYGIASVVLSALSYSLGFFNTTLWACACSALRSSLDHDDSVKPSISKFADSKLGPIGLVSALLIGIWARWSFIDQPMRLDEAYSFLTFVNTEWTNVFLYPFPNNHVLNSILERISSEVFGPEPFAIRLPAFISGIALIAATYYLGKRFGGAYNGIVAALLVAIWPYLIFFSTNGRGYSLASLLTVLMAIVCVDDNGKVRNPRIFLLSLLAALGMLTMPSMLFAIVGVMLWVSAALWLETPSYRQVWVDLIAPFAAFFLVVTLVFYTPVTLISGGLQGVMANKEARPLPFWHFAHQIGPHIEVAANALVVDIPRMVALILIVFVIVGEVQLLRKKNYTATLFLPLVVLGSMAVLFLKRSIPFPRTWIFLIPVVLVTAGFGVAGAMRTLRLNVQWSVIILLVVLAGLFSFYVVSRNAIVGYEETGTAPDMPQIADKLQGIVLPGDHVCALPPINVISAYYLRRERHTAEVTNIGVKERIFFVHNKENRPTGGTWIGWKTVAEAGSLIADVWSSADVPKIVTDPAMDCWRIGIDGSNE